MISKKQGTNVTKIIYYVMEKILTIIIPTYNMERYLDNCLTSLIVDDKELMKQLEVLVVIDGAKDRSSEIAHSYQNKYPETFMVIDKDNGNYGSCINRGLKEAKGKYIKILDADDSYDNTSFVLFLEFLNRYDVDLVINDLVYISTKGTVTKPSIFKLPQEKVFDLSALSQEMQLLYGMHRATYRTDKLRLINYFQTEGVSYTDQEWAFSPLTTVNRVAYFPHLLYRYLIGREGQTMDTKVVVRSMSHHIIGAQKMLNDYVNFKELTASQKSIIDYRILLRCSKIYYSYLCIPSLPLEELISFDNFVRMTSEKIYNELNNCNISWMLSYKFIKQWRKTGRVHKMNKLIYLLSVLAGVLRSIKWRLFPVVK